MPSKYTYDYDYFLLEDLLRRYEKIYYKKPNIEKFCALSDYRNRNESEIMPEKLGNFKNNNIEKDDSMEINIRKNKLNFDYSDTKNRNDDIIFENNKDQFKQNLDTFYHHFYLELFKIVQMDKELNILKKNLLQNYSNDIWKIFKIFDIYSFHV